jgi:hypothetical protein
MEDRNLASLQSRVQLDRQRDVCLYVVNRLFASLPAGAGARSELVAVSG